MNGNEFPDSFEMSFPAGLALVRELFGAGIHSPDRMPSGHIPHAR